MNKAPVQPEDPKDPISDFSYNYYLKKNDLANAYFRLGEIYEAGIGVSPNNAEAAKWYRIATDLGHKIAPFKIGMPGQTLSNQEIADIFFCSTQGGMRRSNLTNSLILVSRKSENPYEDKWIGDIFHYTGMGQTGDQRKDFMQNKTLDESNSNGINIYLFELDNRVYTFEGRVRLAGQSYFSEQRGRKVVMFPLKLIKPLNEITHRIPTAELKKVLKANILSAIEKYRSDSEKHSFGDSVEYDLLLDDGTRLPPKAIFGIAASEALGYQLTPQDFSSGVGSVCFRVLSHNGFNILPKQSTSASEEDSIELKIQQMDEVVNSGKRSVGQGFNSDTEEKKAIEARAMEVAWEYLLSEHYVCTDTSSNHPYDIKATKNDHVLKVEVKGTKQKICSSVLMTKNEVYLHQNEKGETGLIIVYGIQTQLDPEFNTLIGLGGEIEVLLGPDWDIDQWGEIKPTHYQIKRFPKK